MELKKKKKKDFEKEKVPQPCHNIELCSHVQIDLKEQSPGKEAQEEEMRKEKKYQDTFQSQNVI